MKWYSNYFDILRLSSQIPEESAGVIYAAAFNALRDYGVGQYVDGQYIIENNGLIYALANNTLETQEEVDEIEVFEEPEEDQHVDDVASPNVSFSDGDDDSGIILGFSEVPPNPFSSEEDEQEGVFHFGETNEKESNPFGVEELLFVDEGVEPLKMPDVPFDASTTNPFEDGGLKKENETVDFAPPFEEPLHEIPVDSMELELLPEDIPAPEMPLFLNSEDFTFSIHGITSKDLKEQAAFIVAPIRLDLPKTTCIVQAVINGGTYLSTTDEDGHLEFETDDYRYVVDGKMVDGKFVSTVIIRDVDMSDFNVREKTFGDKGHVVLSDEEEGIYVHIIPTSVKPNAFGNADFIYCIDTGDDDYMVDSNHQDKSALVEINGQDYEIIAKWQDKTLYAKIVPK